MVTDRWMQAAELARLFGLSQDSKKRLAKKHGLPLRRATPFAKPGALESELIERLKALTLLGPLVRPKRRPISK